MGLFDFLKKKEPVQTDSQQPADAPVNPVSTYPVEFDNQQPTAVPSQAPVDNSLPPVTANMSTPVMDPTSNLNQPLTDLPVAPIDNVSGAVSPSSMDTTTPAYAPVVPMMPNLSSTTNPLVADNMVQSSTPMSDATFSSAPSGLSSPMSEPVVNPDLGGGLDSPAMPNPLTAPTDTTSVPTNGAY